MTPPLTRGNVVEVGGIEPARPDLRYRCSKGVRAGQSMFPGCPVHAFTSPGSRRTASNVCHRVKTVSNKRAEGFCPFGSGDGFTRRVAARGAGRFRGCSGGARSAASSRCQRGRSGIAPSCDRVAGGCPRWSVSSDWSATYRMRAEHMEGRGSGLTRESIG